MKLFPALEKKYSSEEKTAQQALRQAHEITFGPVVFQVSRLMVKFGILQMLLDSEKGLSLDEIVQKTASLSRYAVQVLLESSLTAGSVLYKDGRFEASKTGWCLVNDPLARVNMDFNQDVNYLGLFSLEEALLNGKPEGLKVFGPWPTIYEGLPDLPERARESWLAFDHFYSNLSFGEALDIVFAYRPRSLLDVGGNTGLWAMRCLEREPEMKVAILDLPGQIRLMRQQTNGLAAAERILTYEADVLDKNTTFPTGFDAIWMSQFLDCFAEEEAGSILARLADAMQPGARLFIMETFWDRQRFETAAYCLTQISLYFTAMANGNSKMYHSGDMIRCVEAAGLEVEKICDGLGKGHSILICKKK